MDSVTIITGGGGGMGLAVARLLAREDALLLADVNGDRLTAACDELADTALRYCDMTIDVTDARAVETMFDEAAHLGVLRAVVHTAGVSPSMGDAEYIMRTNAIGTVNVNEAFHARAPEGAAIVNVASMAAHMLPDEIIPTAAFPLATEDPEEFLTQMLAACEIAPPEARPGLSYAIGKSFVKWYSSAQAERFNARGQRIVSVSPGSVDTMMGGREEQAGAGAMVADAAVPRWGTAEEMAALMVFCVGPTAGYLTGTDILNDGGVIASMRERARKAAG